MDEAKIKAAAAFWTQTLRQRSPQQNGDPTQSLLALMVAAQAPEPTEEQLAKFQSVLEVSIQDSAGGKDGNWLYIGVDYHPDKILEEAAAAAGISPKRFPIKSSMNINPSGVEVAIGYGTPYAVIYGTKNEG